MPYFAIGGSQGRILTYKTEKCRTCNTRDTICPARPWVFTNRGIKPKILSCDRWTPRPKTKGARIEI